MSPKHLILSGFLALACESMPHAGCGPQQEVNSQVGGDERVVQFVVPVAKAREVAAQERRLIFLKPVYGGMDADGAMSYCWGTW